MPKTRPLLLAFQAVFLLVLCTAQQQEQSSPIRFELKKLPFRLDSNESQARNVPETMAGGVAVFDYNGDGRPDIFFANGADLATMKKSSAKYSNRLLRNDVKVTESASSTAK